MKPEHRAFLDAFQAGEIPNTGFGHRDHLLMAWLYLSRDGPERGTERIVAGIRRFADARAMWTDPDLHPLPFWGRADSLTVL